MFPKIANHQARSLAHRSPDNADVSPPAQTMTARRTWGRDI
jgi:hypothetical protein